MSRKNTYQEMEVIDKKTGEVTHNVKSMSYTIENEPNYIRFYAEGLLLLSEITKGEMKILLNIIKHANFENCVDLTGSKRVKIAKELSISRNYFDKSLSILKSKKLLHKIGTGEYLLNPFVFGKGKWKTIKKQREDLHDDLMVS